MKLFAKCQACGKRKFLIKKRTYNHPKVSTPIVSQSLQCRYCFKNIKKMLK